MILDGIHLSKLKTLISALTVDEETGELLVKGDGGSSVSETPLTLIGEFSTITENVMTLSEEANALIIENYGSSDFTITINSITITIRMDRIYSTDDLSFETAFDEIIFSTPNPTDFQLLAFKK